MHNPVRIFFPFGLLALLFVLLAACATSSPPTRYYLLTAEPSSGTNRPEGPSRDWRVISLGPVEIPPYLDRPQIVDRISDNRLHLKNFEHWAEPLEANFTRVLAENLGQDLARTQVLIFPEKSLTPVAYRILVRIVRFDLDQTKTAVLTVNWSIIDKTNDRVLKRQRSVFRRVVEKNDQEAAVAARSELIGEFSQEIKRSLQQLADR